MSNFNKIFNSTTITGRANVAKATYASFALLYIIHRLRKRSTKAAGKCAECECKNCHDHGAAAAAHQPDRGSACDIETWRRAIDANQPEKRINTGGSVEHNENGNALNAVEVADAGNQETKTEVHILGPVNAQKQKAQMKACDGAN